MFMPKTWLVNGWIRKASNSRVKEDEGKFREDVMKIIGGQVSMTSSHAYLEQDIQMQSLRIFNNNRINVRQLHNLELWQQDRLELSGQAKQMLRELRSSVRPAASEESQELLSTQDKQKIVMIEDLLEMLTGKKIKINIPDLKLKAQQPIPQQGFIAVSSGRGAGFQFQSYSRYLEQEAVAFNAQGVIKTADGREIRFATQFALQRSYMQESNLTIRGGAVPIDPLVLNFDGPAAALTSEKYSFDLNADGDMDEISFVGSNSGFLALDVNGDGVVNDGRELFGPNSGDGFLELAAYDEDGNGWIDESDSVFGRLKIWFKDEQGNDHLLSLADKQVGAIYLGHVQTEFALKDSVNRQQGQLSSSGIFLTEDGSAGTIQHLDINV